MFGTPVWGFIDYKISTYCHLLVEISEQNFHMEVLLWKSYEHCVFCIPFTWVISCLISACFFFLSDSLGWILTAWCFQALLPMLLVAWFLFLFHLNSCKSTSCVKMLLLCFSKGIHRKKYCLFPPSLACLLLDSVLPEHPCYMLLCVYQWCCEWLMLALWWHQQLATLFFFFSVDFSRGGSKHSLKNNDLPPSFLASPPPPPLF